MYSVQGLEWLTWRENVRVHSTLFLERFHDAGVCRKLRKKVVNLVLLDGKSHRVSISTYLTREVLFHAEIVPHILEVAQNLDLQSRRPRSDIT